MGDVLLKSKESQSHIPRSNDLGERRETRKELGEKKSAFLALSRGGFSYPVVVPVPLQWYFRNFRDVILKRT